MLSGFIYDITLNLKNITGPSLKDKYIVIECDDWGSIRMPSLEVYNHLKNLGFPVDKSHYHRFDTIESADDLEAVFEILNSIKGSDGKPVVMTPIVNTANPDFKAIKACNFEIYHHEPFTDTYAKYNRGSEILKLWKEGIEGEFFVPQSHGREHLCAQIWMEALQKGNNALLNAFDLGFTSVDDTNLNALARQFRPEFFYNSSNQLPFLENSISTGLEIFKKSFGFNATVFVPSNGVFTPKLEEKLYNSGIKYIYFSYIMPIPDEKGGFYKKFYHQYKRSSSGLKYYTRNCAFEPSSYTYKNIDITLRQIQAAFRWNKPAIISTHRVNFVGGLHKSNRDHGIKELILLLKAIKKNWPNVKFISSSNLLDLLYFGK